MKHYKLTNETKVNFLGVTLFRIECILDFKHAKKGDKGGWIEKESNLSDNAWVYGNAEVYGSAWVSGSARVYGSARVSGNAKSTKKVFNANFVYNITLTDNHISFGCIQKTIKEWIKWLESNEIIETKRNTDKFKLIEMSLNLAIEQHKQLNK